MRDYIKAMMIAHKAVALLHAKNMGTQPWCDDVDKVTAMYDEWSDGLAPEIKRTTNANVSPTPPTTTTDTK